MSKSIYNIRCPYCGDSEKKINKKRGYILYNPKNNQYFYYCHNCGISKTIKDFIFDNPDLSNQLNLNDIIGNKNYLNNLDNNFLNTSLKYQNVEFFKFHSVSKINYLNERIQFHPKGIFKLPVGLSPLKNKIGFGFNLYSSGIPFRFVVRNCFNSSPKYLTVNYNYFDCPEYIMGFIQDLNDKIYICEGIFDALSLKNGIPAFGIGNIVKIVKYLISIGIPRYKIVVVTDSDIENKSVLDVIKYCIFSTTPFVYWWNEYLYQYKDINEVPIELRLLINKFVIRTSYSKNINNKYNKLIKHIEQISRHES